MSTAVVATPLQQDSPTIEAHREGAETYSGDSDLCKRKSIDLLEELHLPLGLLPLEDIDEVGYNRTTGFVWLRQQKKRDHTFKKIGRLVSYGNEVTAFVEDRRMRKMTGVKSKELLIWLTLTDMYIDQKDSEKITFKTPAGLSRTFPVSAFDLSPEEAAAYAAATATATTDEKN